STYLACTAPVLIAPAMNTVMWQHPATQRNLQKLRDDGVHLIDPDEGEMACGTFGPGRLNQPEMIVSAALDLLRQQSQRANQFPNMAGSVERKAQTRNRPQDLKGEHFLI